MMGNTPMVFSGPKTAPRHVGNRLKKDPQPMPLTTENTDRTPMDEANGQMASALTPHRNSEMMKLLMGPTKESAANPAQTRPTVEAMFQTDRAMMPVHDEWLMARAKMGIK